MEQHATWNCPNRFVLTPSVNNRKLCDMTGNQFLRIKCTYRWIKYVFIIFSTIKLILCSLDEPGTRLKIGNSLFFCRSGRIEFEFPVLFLWSFDFVWAILIVLYGSWTLWTCLVTPLWLLRNQFNYFLSINKNYFNP